MSGSSVRKGEGKFTGNIAVWDTRSKSIVIEWNTETAVCSLLSINRERMNEEEREEEDFLCSADKIGTLFLWNSKGNALSSSKDTPRRSFLL